MNHLQRVSCLLMLLAALPALAEEPAGGSPAAEVAKIWDEAPHNAFTDLVRWGGKFYCTFREGERHVHGADGKIRLIASEDGKQWESVALWEEEGIDLRDPKLSIAPDGRLMVLIGGSKYVDRKLESRLTRVAFLNPDEDRAPPAVPVEIDTKIRSNDDWLWRVVWHDDVGYGTLYQIVEGGKRYHLHLVRTTDGVRYELVKSFDLKDLPNEATPLFLKNDRMLVVVRNGLRTSLGTSDPPYTEWEWLENDRPLGGPDLELLPTGPIVMGTRAFDDAERKRAYTALGIVTRDGTFDERVRLPSGGDTSYPGMVVHDGKLWVSYYASHEGKTSIYLAKVPLAAFE